MLWIYLSHIDPLFSGWYEIVGKKTVIPAERLSVFIYCLQPWWLSIATATATAAALPPTTPACRPPPPLSHLLFEMHQIGDQQAKHLRHSPSIFWIFFPPLHSSLAQGLAWGNGDSNVYHSSYAFTSMLIRSWSFRLSFIATLHHHHHPVLHQII